MEFRLQEIALTQFKNYTLQSFPFSAKVVGICGQNGIGKTNLLDAIYYLCFTKSYFTTGDANVVKHGEKGFRLSAKFLQQEQPYEITAILRETGKKELTLNGQLYDRLSRHIGKFPAVMIAPDDVAIITGTSDERRKLFDALLCQLNPDYLQQLMDYNKLLQQRNSLLKQFAESGRPDLALLDILDDQLIARGCFVYDQRKTFLHDFLPKAASHYHTIAASNEAIELRYESQLHGNNSSQSVFSNLLRQNRNRDMAAQRTTAGIHRDDLQFRLHAQPFKQIASQGQRKSLLFALKLTEFETLQQQKGFAPILLLDDVFEKLDNNRMTNLLHEVCIEKNGQVFITDTHRERLEAQLSALGCSYQIIAI